jgi:hypothetical protein
VWSRPSPTITIASVALFFSLTGAAFAVGRVTAASADRQVTSAQLAEQRQVERSEHAAWVTTEQQCSAKHIPDGECNTDQIAPIGSGIVTCGSGGCFEQDGTDAPVDEVSPGESCTTGDGRAGVWEAINNTTYQFACEIYASTP